MEVVFYMVATLKLSRVCLCIYEKAIVPFNISNMISGILSFYFGSQDLKIRILDCLILRQFI
jgi:hypothetical protein